MFTSQNISGTKLPEVHRSKEGVRSKPEARKTTCHAQKRHDRKAACIGQGRAGLRRKHEPDCINQPSDVTRRISGGSKIVTGITNSSQHTNGTHDRGINNDKSFHQIFYCTWIHFIGFTKARKCRQSHPN